MNAYMIYEQIKAQNDQKTKTVVYERLVNQYDGL